MNVNMYTDPFNAEPAADAAEMVRNTIKTYRKQEGDLNQKATEQEKEAAGTRAAAKRLREAADSLSKQLAALERAELEKAELTQGEGKAA